MDPFWRQRKSQEYSWWIVAFLGLFAAGTIFIARVGWPNWLLGLLGIVCAVGAIVMQAVKDRAKGRDVSTTTRQQSMRTTGPNAAAGIAPRDVSSRMWGIHQALVDVPYVERDAEREVADALAAGQPVLILGPSMAGKTRMAAELIQELYSARPVIMPDVPNGLATLMNAGEVPRESVLWLDDAERYLGDPSNLKAKWLEELQQADNVIVATMREVAYESFQPHEERPRTQWETLRCFKVVRLRNLPEERTRLAAEVHNPRIREGILKYGLGTYVGGGFLAVERLETGRSTNPVGAAFVLIAIDWQRSGIGEAIPRDTLLSLIPTYIDSDELPLTPVDAEAGLNWATNKTVGGGAFRLLTPSPDGEFRPFDYLVDYVASSGSAVRSSLWRAASEADATAGRLHTAALTASFAGEAEYALRFFQRAALLGDAEAMANFGTALERQDRLAEAEEQYKKAADLGNPHGMTGLGLLLMRRGELAEAEQLLLQAANAGVGDAMSNLGRLIFRRGETVEAVEWYRRAAAAGSGLGMTNYGIQLEKEGRLEEAELLYREASARRNGAGMYQLAKLLEARGHQDEAEALLRQAVANGNPAAMVALAMKLAERGRQDEANGLFERAAGKDDEVALTIVGKRLLDAGQYEQAQPLLMRAAEHGSGFGMFYLGLVHAQFGEKEQAKVQYRRAAETGHIHDINTLLSLADRLNGDKCARPLYRTAADLGSVYAMHRLASILRLDGEHEEADSLLVRARAQEAMLEKAAFSGDTDSILQLGTIEAGRGHLDKARTLFRQAAERGSAYAAQCLAALPSDP